MKNLSNVYTVDLSAKLEDIAEFDKIGNFSFNQAEMLDIQNMSSIAIGYLKLSLHAYEKEKEIVLDIKQDPNNLVESLFNVYDLSLCLSSPEIAKTSCQSMISIYNMLIENNNTTDKYKEELAFRHELLAELYLDEENIEQAKLHVQKSINILTQLSQDDLYYNTDLATALTCMGTIIHDFEHNLSEAIKLYEQAKEIFEKEIDLDPDSIDDIDNFHTKLKTLLVYYDESNDSDNYQKIELKIKQMESLQAERKKKYLLRIPAPTLCPDLNSN